MRGGESPRPSDLGVTMPRFMSLIRIDEQNPFDAPDPEFDQRMGALFEEITKAGVMLETAGPTPTSWRRCATPEPTSPARSVGSAPCLAAHNCRHRHRPWRYVPGPTGRPC
ncbi:hypothetical protein SAMN02787144_1011217 [Streptomyces atratus]|uniref:Uncharacterized protein n=1 Tax=Streptomyces atratus TaxID=1893 RepID=A0A1K2CV88_STRAR|nr:hypothetical protein SAMN02787144_1011217 [Streptomyces atratus]